MDTRYRDTVGEMDAQARTKALFRSKLKAQKKEKRLDSPLVRYNESDQPVCRVCNVALKSESQWDAHQASRKHHEAIDNLKANAARATQASNVKPGLPSKFFDGHVSDTMPNAAKGTQASSAKMGLPPKFFDDHLLKTPVAEKSCQTLTEKALQSQTEVNEIDTVEPQQQYSKAIKHPGDSEIKQLKGGLPEDFFDKTDVRSLGNSNEGAGDLPNVNAPEAKQPQGALPEGFFDNKEADLRARGIKPVKVDVKDEYKEFEKLIQEDLQEVDNRMEEEEIDAAETIEEAESLEQKVYNEKVELLRKRKLELEASREAKRAKDAKVEIKESNDEGSSSDNDDYDDDNEDDDDDFAVDWRAQHL